MGPLKVVGLVAAVAFLAIVGTIVVQQRTGVPSEDSVDVGFLQDMIAHHGQAVQLGTIASQTAADPTVARFGLEAVTSQQYEVGYMTALLEDWGLGTNDASDDREAMAWMGMGMSVGSMPGMASADQLEAFRTMTGDQTDAEFLRLMSDHHRGGFTMARTAADKAADPRVRALATRIANNQGAELREYEALADRLGVQL